MKILITGGNNAKALKLMKAFPNHFVLLADYGDVPSIISENYAFTTLGKLNKDSIAHILLNFCITESIDSIIPLHHFEMEPLAKSSVLFNEYGIQVLLPDADVIQNFMAEKTIQANFVVFISGECIYSSSGKVPQYKSEHLNGVFGFNEVNDDLNLYNV